MLYLSSDIVVLTCSSVGGRHTAGEQDADDLPRPQGNQRASWRTLHKLTGQIIAHLSKTFVEALLNRRRRACDPCDAAEIDQRCAGVGECLTHARHKRSGDARRVACQ
jgi:hypothetical protein